MLKKLILIVLFLLPALSLTDDIEDTLSLNDKAMRYLNGDGVVNVVDIVIMVNWILGSTSE